MKFYKSFIRGVLKGRFRFLQDEEKLHDSLLCTCNYVFVIIIILFQVFFYCKKIFYVLFNFYSTAVKK